MASKVHHCDFCKEIAKYDGKTVYGPWAFMCEQHFQALGIDVEGLHAHIKQDDTKCCSHCGEVKPLESFYKYTDARGVERRRNECKECNLTERKTNSIIKARHSS